VKAEQKHGQAASVFPARSSAISEARRSPYSFRRKTTLKGNLSPGEKGYLEAIAQLTSLMKKSADVTLQPRLRAEYKRNLAVVDQAIAATRLAAHSHPDNPQMAQFLLAAYRGKLGLLTTIVEQSRVLATEF
jgi:hypothetical protein